MTEKFPVNAKFRIEGVFWNPEKPHERFSAALTRSTHFIELETPAQIVGPEKMFVSEEPNPALLHGLTTQGVCTLVGIHHVARPGYFGTDGTGVVLNRLRVDLCIIGIHLGDERSLPFNTVVATYPLEKWMPSKIGDFALTDEGRTLTLAYSPQKQQSIFDLTFLPAKTRFKLAVRPLVTWDFNAIAQAAAQPELRLELYEPKSLEWLITVIRRVENFFTLCLGTSLAVESIEAQMSQNESAWIVYRQRTKTAKPDPSIWARCDAQQLANALLTWLSLPEEFEPLENLIYLTIRTSRMFVETEFLALAQAIESFHRITDHRTITPEPEFDENFRWLTRFVRENWQESLFANRLLDATRTANEPDFKERIKRLLSRVAPENVSRLVGDAEQFEQTLRQTRNYFTHPGIRKQSNVLASAGEIFLFNQKLHALLRLLVLTHIGFPQGAVIDAVFQQSRKWTIR